ncbi:hypothetical protein BKA62DRAFT_794207 [Auriculariales sp. MPI-PUGE-AT-0066]|nr:hypothetical protein BKA62DRAFT_794207 [Auriculariales sp. MPI-PUGE-AT-0066]
MAATIAGGAFESSLITTTTTLPFQWSTSFANTWSSSNPTRTHWSGTTITGAGYQSSPMSSSTTVSYSREDERGNVWESRDQIDVLAGEEISLQQNCPFEGIAGRQLLRLSNTAASVSLNTTAGDFELYLWSPTKESFYISAAGENWSNFMTITTDDSDQCPHRYDRNSIVSSSVTATNASTETASSSQPSILSEPGPMLNLTVGAFGSTVYIFNLTLPNTGNATSTQNIPHQTALSQNSSGKGFQLALVAVPLGIALALLLGLVAICYERRRRRAMTSIFHPRTESYANGHGWRASGTTGRSITSSLSPLSASFEQPRTFGTLVSRPSQKHAPNTPPAVLLFSPLSSASPNSAHPLLKGYNVDPFADTVGQGGRTSQASMASSRRQSSIVILRQPEISSLRRASSSAVPPSS